jgi:hypothetical protein
MTTIPMMERRAAQAALPPTTETGTAPARGALRQTIEDAARASGSSLADLTVLAPQNDPYRLDTPAGHRDAAWFAMHMERALRESKRKHLHLRGFHYFQVARGDVRKPNGEIYRNTDEDWTWLQAHPAKAARWLGYVPFEQIADERNEPPTKYRRAQVALDTWIDVGVEVTIPDASDIEPRVSVTGFVGRQPYHIVIFGEKSSLGDVLGPLALRYHADLYLPTGEITDTLLYEMAKDGASDGRPMQIFTLSDCDPAGWQMPVSIGRKLQALHDLSFPTLQFALRPIALTHDQVRELGLPSTPLKETERRADRWRQAFGVEQTEIDALATIQPDVLTAIVRDEIAPFWDRTLELRVSRASMAWRASAQAALTDQSDAGSLAALRRQAVERLAGIEQDIASLNEALRQAVPDTITLPAIEIPEAEIDAGLHGKPCMSSGGDWATATQALIARKRYGDNAGGGR